MEIIYVKILLCASFCTSRVNRGSITDNASSHEPSSRAVAAAPALLLTRFKFYSIMFLSHYFAHFCRSFVHICPDCRNWFPWCLTTDTPLLCCAAPNSNNISWAEVLGWAEQVIRGRIGLKTKHQTTNKIQNQHQSISASGHFHHFLPTSRPAVCSARASFCGLTFVNEEYFSSSPIWDVHQKISWQWKCLVSFQVTFYL